MPYPKIVAIQCSRNLWLPRGRSVTNFMHEKKAFLLPNRAIRSFSGAALSDQIYNGCWPFCYNPLPGTETYHNFPQSVTERVPPHQVRPNPAKGASALSFHSTTPPQETTKALMHCSHRIKHSVSRIRPNKFFSASMLESQSKCKMLLLFCPWPRNSIFPLD